EQFEDEFVRLVERDKRIKIIFIDDLDRCPEDKVIETLETIKTYLDVRTCIFLIACDDDVILSIVEKKREELLKNSDSNDYLNKFFQYTLKIPPFIHQNMQAYALDLLRVQGSSLNNLEDIKDIMYVLIHNNVKDPRKVITLLNAFASDYQAVCNRENKDSGKLEVGEITNNLPTLAVFSVLKTEYPYFYDLLIRDSHFLEYILKVHDEEYNLIEPHHMDILKLIYNVPDNYQNLEDRSLWFSSYVIGKKQRQFVDYVIKVESYIKDLKDIGLYLYLDKHQSQFALSGELERQLRDDLSIASLKAVRESYSKLKTDESRKNFFNVAIECIRNFGYSHEKVNGLSVLFSIVENAPPEDIFLQIISKQIMDLLNHLEEKAKWWGHFNLNGVFFVLKHLGSVDKKDEFIKKIVSVLNNTFDIHVDFARRVLVSL
ncbi:MAG: hypothetical protein KAI72_00190, partial [Candidatus Pacebacteria bacterium]|nr:hypothetical protein [Candidatus Paceibacterota bacterium]